MAGEALQNQRGLLAVRSIQRLGLLQWLLIDAIPPKPFHLGWEREAGCDEPFTFQTMLRVKRTE